MPILILKLQCPDQVGIVARVSALIAKHHGWIVAAGQYADEMRNQFFMRVEIRKSSLSCEIDAFKAELTDMAKQMHMTWSLVDMTEKKKTVIFASKHYHCLSDLLYRYVSHDLDMDLVAVVSNHPDHEKLVLAHGVKYYYIPFAQEDNAEAYGKISEVLSMHPVDLIILARFMRILPPSICKKYAGKIINIHHSFLPSFVGAKSYERAVETGVKMIGATCHYVTTELDQGPIIEQDVIRISHRHSIAQVKELGRDIEKITLAKGVRYHLEERIMIDQNKTIVFE